MLYINAHNARVWIKQHPGISRYSVIFRKTEISIAIYYKMMNFVFSPISKFHLQRTLTLSGPPI